ncbi:hypothetical protein N0V84_009707 [Fusarium piperis]|uniref:Uncharacterized protein n=1 Tax=Fusarium piperis TaxID=1435070 RepID=A0A9W9BK13_9HYPO|nr:hypothetical protein N0V84_009707 [Fusarium piperis]
MRVDLSASVLSLLSLQLFGSVAARRGGGDSGGDSGGSSGGSSGGGSSDGGSSGGTSGGGSSGYPYGPSSYPNGLSNKLDCGLGECGCQQLQEREMLFGLPGIYYNGIITIRHHIKNSSTWEFRGANGCGNDDDDEKEYTYPALFVAAPRGNSSDVNPFYWNLYGFQPADQTNQSRGPYLDVYQRWVQIRSSDFVLSKTSYGGSFTFDGSDALYRNSDSTNDQQTTRVYWDTKITDWDGDKFSASAEYTRVPPIPNNAYIPYRSRYDVRTSQYFTLSDVCAYNQTTGSASGPLPPSVIPKGNDYLNTTTPTLWLNKGAKAEMKDIGSKSMTFSLEQTIKSAIPYMSERQAICGKREDSTFYMSTVFERSPFWEIRAYDKYDAYWSMDLDISIEFKGEIVSENSTKITGRQNGDVTFGRVYATPRPTGGPGGSGGSASSAISLTELSGVATWVLTMFSMALLVFVA